jgi:chemotaxis protein MotB
MIPFLHRVAAPQEDHPLWLIVLADMMTNLMLFFLVMYALTLQGPQAREAMARTFDAKDVVVPAPPAPSPALRENAAAAELKALFSDTTIDEHVIRVRLRDNLLFAFADAGLAPAAADPLARLARVLKEMPNTVVVEGHTDDVPVTNLAYKSNWELSVARAGSVIERLAAEGVPAPRLVASGYGEHRPLSPNATAEGRARNRRVEILILRGKDDQR